MAVKNPPVYYPYEWDSLAQQRIPVWLSEDLTQIICSLARSRKRQNRIFLMEPSDYQNVIDIMAGLGLHIPRTAIWHAYRNFLKLNDDQLDAFGRRATRDNGLIPDGYRRLQKYMAQTKAKDISFGTTEEAEDIIRLSHKPSPLVKYLDMWSLEKPDSVRRAIKIASEVQCEDDEDSDKAAELQVQRWAGVDSASRVMIEAEWGAKAKSQKDQKILKKATFENENRQAQAIGLKFTEKVVRMSVEWWFNTFPVSAAEGGRHRSRSRSPEDRGRNYRDRTENINQPDGVITESTSPAQTWSFMDMFRFV